VRNYLFFLVLCFARVHLFQNARGARVENSNIICWREWVARRGRNSSGMHMTQKSLTQQRDELTIKLEQLEEKHADLHKLVNTLLTIIMEEADGVQSGAAPTIKNQPARGYCM